jgi:hypothetical protein
MTKIVGAVALAVGVVFLGTFIAMLFAGALLASLGVSTLGFWQVFWAQALLGSAGAALGTAKQLQN